MTDPSELTHLELRIERELLIAAPITATFEALLEQIAAGMARSDGVGMPLKLEAFPGGRWFRDLGDGDGHFWGHVQAIKRPTLLELCGPLFMSSPTSNNVQYRLEEVEGGTMLRLVHTAFGPMPDGVHDDDGVAATWEAQFERISQAAESRQGRRTR